MSTIITITSGISTTRAGVRQRAGLMLARFDPGSILVVCAVAMIALSVVAVSAWADSDLEQRFNVSFLQRMVQDQPGPSAAPPATPPTQQSAPKPTQGAPATAVAPAPPSPAIASWARSLVAHLDRFKRYPAQARGAHGVVTLAFRIDRQGNIVSSGIVKGSGSAVLDAEALVMIKRAAPFPPPPPGTKDDQLSFTLPIRFAARDER